MFIVKMLGHESKSSFHDMAMFTFTEVILFIGTKARNTIGDAVSSYSFRNIRTVAITIRMEAFDFGIK